MKNYYNELFSHFFQTFDIELNVGGKNWDEANARAQKVIEDDPEAFFVHPFSQVYTVKGMGKQIVVFC